MGTRTKTLRDTKTEEDTEKIAKCSATAKKLADAYLLSDYTNMWKCIDYSIELITLQHLTTQEVNRVWKKAFKIDVDNGDNNNMVSVCSRLANVGMFFANNNERAKKLYKEWKGKCTIHAIFYKVRDVEKNAIKRIEKKEKMSKEQLQKDADEGVVNAEEYADSIEEPVRTKPNKDKEEPKAYNRAESFKLDKELKTEMKKLIRGEPIVFYRMIVGFAEVNLLSEEWKQLALEEMEKLV